MPRDIEQFSSFERKISSEKEIKESEKDKTREEEEVVLRIIEHPVMQKALANFKIFSKYYFEGLEKSDKEKLVKEGIKPPTREEIKKRAYEIIGKEKIYKDILEMKKVIKNEGFLEYIREELGEERINKMKGAEKEDKFDEDLKEILIKRQIERAKAKEKISQTEKEKIVRVGNIWVKIENGELRPHFPRFTETMEEFIRGINDSFKKLAILLQKDERFRNIKKLDGMSWLFGEKEEFKKYFEDIGWHNYTEEKLSIIKKEDPDGYKKTQRVGIMASPHLFKEYLLKGKWPKIGGMWIEKEDFINKIKGVKDKEE